MIKYTELPLSSVAALNAPGCIAQSMNYEASFNQFWVQFGGK